MAAGGKGGVHLACFHAGFHDEEVVDEVVGGAFAHRCARVGEAFAVAAQGRAEHFIAAVLIDEKEWLFADYGGGGDECDVAAAVPVVGVSGHVYLGAEFHALEAVVVFSSRKLPRPLLSTELR